MEKISILKALPKGESTRILEVRAYPILSLEKEITDVLSAKIIGNYGHAAVPYLQFVMNNLDSIKTLYSTTQKKLDKMCGFAPSDRFYSVIVANAIMGLMIAKRAKLIDFDIASVVKWIVAATGNLKEQAKSMDVDAETVLARFLAENYNNILRIKSTDDARTLGNKVDLDHLIIPDATPRMSFMVRYEYDEQMMFIYPAPLKDWCVKHQINYEGLVESLKQGRTKAKMDKKRMGKGTRMSLPSVDVLWVNCKDWLNEEELVAAAEHKAALEGDAAGPIMP
jgi:hypothetical protein